MSKEHTRRHIADSRGRFILLPRLQDQQLLLPHRLLPGSHLQLLDQPLLLLLIQRTGTKFRYQRTSPGVAHDTFTLLYPLPWKAPSKTPASSLRLRRHLSSFFSRPEKPPSFFHRTQTQRPPSPSPKYLLHLSVSEDTHEQTRTPFSDDS